MIYTNTTAPAKPISGIVGKNKPTMNFTIAESQYKRELRERSQPAPKLRAE